MASRAAEPRARVGASVGASDFKSLAASGGGGGVAVAVAVDADDAGDYRCFDSVVLFHGGEQSMETRGSF